MSSIHFQLEILFTTIPHENVFESTEKKNYSHTGSNYEDKEKIVRDLLLGAF